MRRLTRIAGTLMIVAGVGAVVWVVLVWQWQDPFTALYTKYEQHKLASRFSDRFADYKPPASIRPATKGPDGSVSVAAEQAHVRAEATAYRHALKEGDPVGRLRVPRFGLKSIVVNGTSHDDLTKGPGRDLRTYMPGQGELIYIAGHRTTYLAPFSHIDTLKPGDPITLEVPYGTFHYEVTAHRIVPAGDLSVLESHHREQLVLQACHPRFFASHRYLAYAKLVRVEPRNGRPYSVGTDGPLA
jgi:sortase A